MEKHFKIRKDLSIAYYGRTLYRIEATKDLLDHNVNKGDIGGWIEKEENLGGDAWIADESKIFDDAVVVGNAKVYDEAEVYGCAKVYGKATVHGNARVFGDAEVFGNAEVSGNTTVCGNAEVYDYTHVFDNAKVCGNATVSDNACVYGNATVCGFATVCGDARVYGEAWVPMDVIMYENDCKNITGDKHNITITPNFIKIGCEYHTKEEWWNFTDREILKMDSKAGRRWWKKWKPILQLIYEEEQ